MKKLLCLCLLLALLCPAAMAEARPEWCRNYEDVIRLKCDPPRYLAEIGDYWSLLDAEGQVIEEKYVFAVQPFYEGLALVFSPDEGDISSGFINEAGDLITGFDFYFGGKFFSDGLCSVRFAENKLYGCINSEGEIVIEPKYEILDNFSEGLACFGAEGKVGYINTNDEIVIAPIYDAAGAFHEGRALVKAENGLYGYIDTSWNMVIEPVFMYASYFSDGLARVETTDNKWGYIRPDGSFAIEPVYSYAEDFQNGYAVVGIDSGKYDPWGLIDASGNVIIPIEYDYLYLQRGVNLALEEITAWGAMGEELHCFRFENGRAVEVNTIVHWDESLEREYDTSVIPLDASAEKPRFQSMPQLHALYRGLSAAAGYDDYATRNLLYSISGIGYEWNAEGLMLYAETPAENYSKFYENAMPYDMLPIAKDALVFVVPEDSPIENLSVEQIKAIYSGEITDWSQLGAEGIGKITAYQKYGNEWAQIEFERFMQDIWLMTPPLEFEEGDYGDYQRPCDFAALPGAIGFEIKSMIDYDRTKGLKYLSIDGVAPTAENIANGSYPFTVNICALYNAEEDNPNVQILLDWMRSAQGRELIEESGYVAW